METYISILRGINVSGKNIIKMADLKAMYQSMLFEEVKTYIQSGNVIFRTNENDTKALEDLITQKIKNSFGFDVPVIVFKSDTLAAIVAHNPYVKREEKDTSFMHITFLAEPPKTFDKEQIVNKKKADEEISFSDKVLYLYCPNGYGKTKLTTSFLEKKLNVKTTTRNWKTTLKLLTLATQ